MAGNGGCSGHSDRNSWALISWTWSRKYREQTESSVRLGNLKACPSDIVPPGRLHVLNLPNSSSIKYQVFKHLSVWGEGAFSLKPPQYSILNYWQYNCQLIKCGQYMDLETKQDKRTPQWGNLVDAVSTRQSRSASTRQVKWALQTLRWGHVSSAVLLYSSHKPKPFVYCWEKKI